MWVDHCKRRDVPVAEREFHDQMNTPRDQHPYYKTYVQHAGNGGEYYVQYVNGTVDGYDREANTVYEYQGCFWHGCEQCYPSRTEAHTRLAGRQMYEVRENTRRKIAKLRSLGPHVVEMWGCQWAKEKEINEECRTFVNQLDFMERLNPLDAFFGGRTNATKLYHRCNEHEHIEYVDFTSLYPTINKYGQYPIKHPEVYLHPQDQDISHYYGIAKCRVRAPRGLYHPVLPVRIGEKLMFPLCVKCAETELEKPLLERSCFCPHDDVDHEFIGTWCTPELMVAKDKGYDIVEIYEVFHFKEEHRQVGLFAPYVDKWYKLKMEASGWPESCQTEEQKQAFFEEFYEREHIRLSYEELEKGGNPGLRSLAKLMLNSMWGKFGQRPNKTQVTHFTDPDEFHEFLESDKYQIQKFQLYPDNEDVVDVFCFTHSKKTTWKSMEK